MHCRRLEAGGQKASHRRAELPSPQELKLPRLRKPLRMATFESRDSLLGDWVLPGSSPTKRLFGVVAFPDLFLFRCLLRLSPFLFQRNNKSLCLTSPDLLFMQQILKKFKTQLDCQLFIYYLFIWSTPPSSQQKAIIKGGEKIGKEWERIEELNETFFTVLHLCSGMRKKN